MVSLAVTTQNSRCYRLKMGIFFSNYRLFQTNWTGVNKSGYSWNGPSGSYTNRLNIGLYFLYLLNKTVTIGVDISYYHLKLSESIGCTDYYLHKLKILNISPTIEHKVYKTSLLTLYEAAGISLCNNILSLDYYEKTFYGITFNIFINLGIDFRCRDKMIIGPIIKINYYHKKIKWNKSFTFISNEKNALPLSGIELGLRCLF